MQWTPNDKQRGILESLQAESKRDGNATQFCRDYAPFSYPKFSKIMNVLDGKPSYFDEIKDQDSLMKDLGEWLSKLPRMRLERERARENPIYRIFEFDQVAESVRQCKNKTSPERITKCISPTGGGKTTLRRFLAAEFRNELAVSFVECRDSWRASNRDKRNQANRTALTDICKGVGMRFADIEYLNVPEIEDALTEYLTETVRLVFFDEGEFFTRYVLNLVKMLLNKTRVLFVIACTPYAHAKWNNYFKDEALQIDRRTHYVAQMGVLRKKDVGLFFEDGQFDDPKVSIEYITKQASIFGHYSLIARIANVLRKSSKAEQVEVVKMIALAQKHMGHSAPSKSETPVELKAA